MRKVREIFVTVISRLMIPGDGVSGFKDFSLLKNSRPPRPHQLTRQFWGNWGPYCCGYENTGNTDGRLEDHRSLRDAQRVGTPYRSCSFEKSEADHSRCMHMLVKCTITDPTVVMRISHLRKPQSSARSDIPEIYQSKRSVGCLAVLIGGRVSRIDN